MSMDSNKTSMTSDRDALNIAIVAACPFPYPRGTPVRIHRMAEALAVRGHDVHVAAYHLGEDAANEPFATHRIMNVPTYKRTEAGPSPQKLLVCDPLLVMKLAQVYRKQKIDVVHAHHFEGLLAALAAPLFAPGTGASKIPIVFDAHVLLTAELHYYGGGQNVGFLKRLKQSIAKRFDDALPRRAAHTVTVTDEIRDKLIARHGVAPENVTALVNGVEIEHFDVPRVTRADSPTKTLLFTGNLATYQGVDLMLEAFAKLRERRRDVTLKIVTGSSFEEYEAKAKDLNIRDAIEITDGKFSELPHRMAECDIALNPRVEGDGIAMKLLNYMAAGIPVVSFAGTAKLIEHVKSGWIVADNDTEAFADGIDHLLNHREEAERIGVAAKAFATANLSWGHVAERSEAIYRKLISEAGNDKAGAIRGDEKIQKEAGEKAGNA